MNKHPIPNIVGMEILNLEVVDFDGCFEQLMLYLLDNNVLSVNCEKYVAGFKMYCVSPALAWYVERMRRCCDYLFAAKGLLNSRPLVIFIRRYPEHRLNFPTYTKSDWNPKIPCDLPLFPYMNKHSALSYNPCDP